MEKGAISKLVWDWMHLRGDDVIAQDVEAAFGIPRQQAHNVLANLFVAGCLFRERRKVEGMQARFYFTCDPENPPVGSGNRRPEPNTDRKFTISTPAKAFATAPLVRNL